MFNGTARNDYSYGTDSFTKMKHTIHIYEHTILTLKLRDIVTTQ